ncbi:ATP-dependent RNA helicase HrpA [Pectobacterium carotovorum]|uniref:ATP-dependent RNA helicase HrpA n=2 Tax=Pectobacterium carotovorum TaxID=554 RepID=UPI00057D8837|nr:ATP-dependent RNA helicase HrpA [Pectobacterium carotovorum]KHT37606.1 ATP-dependent helicase HrpA [Pectobacterium carotovorum subsp. carotovorum]MBA0193606.1 ATP-dependent RNA helicase HrpA [Pectobacterium carotovorum]MBA0202233.1 ATP-dependent RNA helicase HrpA [Pectobacterium carotovorum]QHP58145.1 ATP-dependent RNA helicase HrpA [Pectobacterium carotovorum subsp. carotovorum]RJL49270.1 ATP-dependent RNA helicase HrpA [Pectobacterium carotovorum]
MKSPLSALSTQLSELMLRDRQRLRRRLQGAAKVNSPQAQAAIAQEIEGEIAAARQKVENRRASCPAIHYPEQLPVSQKKDEILEALRHHQVIIVAGETGSGKTTQLPKICLELGRGVHGLIGHTQPRRLAARTVADRIAAELETPLGGSVGYKVRFNDQVGDNTLVKLMTDGILLAEIQQDRLLMQYDTLIIDEAHERSLNIDFIMGYLRQLLPKRPDLKVIITSATIDPQRFSRHFNNAPIIEVSGRTYPVDVRYRPVVEDADDSERDQLQAIFDAVDELTREGPGDILVFMSGEREIRDTAEALTRLDLPHTEILPLYARLSNQEQNRVFQSHHGRRIVLATNVAETSLTVPGIRYVIDPGTARISRYSFRTKVQRLPIEPVSQASANQRKGRCGRVAAGVCIRLYSEQDFLSRPEFTDPEILRTNLASVILQMTSLGLGDIAAFPFVEAPDKRNIQDGVRLLEELGAINLAENGHYRLTPQGQQLAQLPIDPRLARMVLEARKTGCVREVMIITAALSIQDPRERPMDKKQASDEKHRRFADKDSDFLAFVNLWDYLRDQQKALSSSQFRRQCRTDFLNYLRVREWQDIYTQLRQVVKELGLPVNSEPADYLSIHCALLTGLLSHIGQKDIEKQEFSGARNARFAIFPGSGLFKKPPKWTMVAELVETSRLWGRIAARIEPEWIEPLAQHLIKRSYSDPHWEKAQGTVMAQEKVTLFGLPIVAARKVNYSQIDPTLAREMFIRHALVEGDWQTHHAFFRANLKLLAEVEDLEHKSRRRDILVDDETLFAFYDQRLPHDVVSSRHFDTWWKAASRDNADLLNFEKSMLIKDGAEKVSALDYPNFWHQGSLKLRLSYQFEPGADADGVTVHIPLPILNQVREEGFEWQIPGVRRELTIALIKSLPKPLRRNFVPAPNYAEAFLARTTPLEKGLLDALERELRLMTGVTVPREAWQWDQVPDHLKITFRVVDEKNRTQREGKDLNALKDLLKDKVQQTLSSVVDDGLEQRGLHVWSFGSLPDCYEQKRGGYSVKAYPALVDEKDSVAIRLFDTPHQQQQVMRQGLRRLLLLNIPSPIKYLHEKLPNKAKLGLYFNPYGKVLDLIDDCIACAVDKLIESSGGPVWQEEAFQQLHEKVRAELNDTVVDIAKQVEQILTAVFTINKRLKGRVDMAMALALSDIKSQMNGLVFRGFVTENGWQRLPDVLRYLHAIERRLEKLAQDVHRDRAQMLKVEHVQQAWQQWWNKLPAERRDDDDVKAVRWMLEELRVSYFAQQLGTPFPISDKRVLQAMEQVEG